jgi:preprotein translocase subunit SecE
VPKTANKASRSAGSSSRPKVPLPSDSGGGNYFAQVIAELKKVIWPTRPELGRMTGIVIATVLIFSALIGGADWILATGANAVYKAASATPTPKPAATATPNPTSTPKK